MPEAQFTLALLNLLMTVLLIPKSSGMIPRKNPFIKKTRGNGFCRIDPNYRST